MLNLDPGILYIISTIKSFSLAVSITDFQSATEYFNRNFILLLQFSLGFMAVTFDIFNLDVSADCGAFPVIKTFNLGEKIKKKKTDLFQPNIILSIYTQKSN